MNRFALLTFYRSLVRHKLYAALNIGGLAVGIAVFLVLGALCPLRDELGAMAARLPRHIYLIEAQFRRRYDRRQDSGRTRRSRSGRRPREICRTSSARGSTIATRP